MVPMIGLALWASTANPGPCDIYEEGGTPCVAAHATTRALYGSYDGPLYEVIRGSDNQTASIAPAWPGGPAKSWEQDQFCEGTTCLINVIYDQSGRDNHMSVAPPGGAAKGPNPGGFDFKASAIGAPVMVMGQKAYGVFTPPGTGYRVDNTSGVATGNDPEGIFVVLDGTHYGTSCCWDYGNAETNDLDNDKTHMEALWFGSGSGKHMGPGPGPWIQVDMENGVFGGNLTAAVDANPSDKTIDYRFVTAITKGNSSNLWAIRGGNAQSGTLENLFEGERPPGYYPMNKEGAIILGIGGDNSDRSQGTFYEGAMLSGYPTDETEDKVQVNVVAAKYETTSLLSGPPIQLGSKVSFKASDGMYLGHSGSNVSLVDSKSSDEAKFTVQKGLGFDGCYSFESVDSPGSFLRAFQYQVYCDSSAVNRTGEYTTFQQDATFCTEQGFSGWGSTALRSWVRPTRYIRPFSNGTVYIGANGGPFVEDTTSSFNQEVSFTVEQSW